MLHFNNVLFHFFSVVEIHVFYGICIIYRDTYDGVLQQQHAYFRTPIRPYTERDLEEAGKAAFYAKGKDDRYSYFGRMFNKKTFLQNFLENTEEMFIRFHYSITAEGNHIFLIFHA